MPFAGIWPVIPNSTPQWSSNAFRARGGYHVGDRDFFLAVCRELRKNDIAIIFDEVQTFGRTTRLFAFQHFGLEEFADIVTIGKLSQLCATLFTPEYKPQPGLVSQTFTTSTSALFTGRAIIRELVTGDYFGPSGKNSACTRLVPYPAGKVGNRPSRLNFQTIWPGRDDSIHTI